MEKESDSYPALPPLNLPSSNLKIISENGETKVFDSLRDKYVVMTPEEYVRQTFVSWLRKTLHYPTSLMANEVGIEVNGAKKRCDTVIFEPSGAPLMIVEYKAPSVVITQDTFDQIVRYNMALKARYLVVSNGITHYCCIIDYSTGLYHFIPTIPDYIELKSCFSEN